MLMVIDNDSRRLARHLFRVTVFLVERHDPSASDVARAALARPNTATIRDLLDAGRGKPWLPSVLDALAEVAAAAAEDVLGGEE
jgi:hypothetical protein